MFIFFRHILISISFILSFYVFSFIREFPISISCLFSQSLMMMKMMMNCFCGMVDRPAFNLISSWDHCQRSSPSRISDTPWAGFEPAQNLISGLVEWSCAVVITTIFLHYFRNILLLYLILSLHFIENK